MADQQNPEERIRSAAPDDLTLEDVPPPDMPPPGPPPDIPPPEFEDAVHMARSSPVDNTGDTNTAVEVSDGKAPQDYEPSNDQPAANVKDDDFTTIQLDGKSETPVDFIL